MFGLCDDGEFLKVGVAIEKIKLSARIELLKITA
jgi:hypothetical protein